MSVKLVLLALASISLISCDGGGYVTRSEARQAFRERDEAIEILARSIQDLIKKTKSDVKPRIKIEGNQDVKSYSKRSKKG